MPCAKFLVSGRVQGVFFRAATRREALALGIRGHANNLRDGRVEVLACGEAAALDELEAWLAHGPPQARVEALQRIDLAGSAVTGSAESSAKTHSTDFSIGYE